MRNILLKLSYDGTDFHGFQLQKKGRTVAQVLHAALWRLHGHELHFSAAGRTDAGVHATGQYVNLHSGKDTLPVAQFVPALNYFLPHDVRVVQSWEVPSSFHARYDAVSREYCYQLYLGRVLPPVYRRTMVGVSFPVLVERIHAEAQELVGVHDFRTFSRVETDISTVREVFLAEFQYSEPFGQFRIIASGFLHRMVRSLVGTLLEREYQRSRGNEPAHTLGKLLLKKERRLAGSTAPARGLCLVNVEYQSERKNNLTRS